MVDLKIKAIVFDVGGVLALPKTPTTIKKRGHVHLGVHEYIAGKLGISLDQWFDSIDTSYAKAIEGKISRNKTLSIISKNVKISPKKLEKIILNAYKRDFKHNKELYKLAYKLRKNKYKIGILSDQWYLSKQALISKKIIKRFNFTIISCDVGIRKPNLKIYKLMIKKLRFKPEEIMFIDNREWNIAPAEKLKINSILYKDNKQLIGELKKYAVVI